MPKAAAPRVTTDSLCPPAMFGKRTIGPSVHSVRVTGKTSKNPPPKEVQEVGARLREARRGIDAAATHLALKSEIAQGSLSRFETGKRGLRTYQLVRLMRAASECGINLDFVFTGRGEKLNDTLAAINARLSKLESVQDEGLTDTQTTNERVAAVRASIRDRRKRKSGGE